MKVAAHSGGLHTSGRGAPYRRRRWPIVVVVSGGALLVLAGAAVVVAWVLGRPHVSVTPASATLAHVRVSGMDTTLAAVRATSSGRSVAVARRGDEVVPTGHLPQHETVHVVASATAPSWLRWLVGGPVSKTLTVRTPSAGPAATTAVTSRPGQVTVSFDQPVRLVEYRPAGGAWQTLRLARPSRLAQLTVPGQADAGSLQVAAAPQRWEAVAPQPTTVTWFVAPAGGAPAALGDPAPGATTVASDATIALRFDQSVAKALGGSRPKLSPAVAGSWSEPDADTLVFTPTGFGYGPDTTVTVTFDRSVAVETAAVTTAAATTAVPDSYHFTTVPGSLLRVEQILAQLHYLPLQFVPAAGTTNPTTLAGEVASMDDPLQGSFSWRWASTPAALQAQWSPGADTLMVKGALMAFDAETQSYYDGYQVDDETVAQLTDTATWKALLEAAAANKVDPEPYSFVYVTEGSAETLDLWENGKVVLTSPANTGIAQDPTATGTYPIYARYTVNTMKGTNPDGTPYDDIVHWINYFNGGDAVHGFDRPSYGTAQSLGCVELPEATAETAFNELTIGDLVDVVT